MRSNATGQTSNVPHDGTVLLMLNAKCPHCGRKFNNYNEKKVFYDTPIRRCPTCTGFYLDRRYVELALQDPPKSAAFNIKSGIWPPFIALMAASGFWIYILLNTAHHIAYRPIVLWLAIILTVIFVLLVIRMFRRMVGRMSVYQLFRKAESVGRMRNREYAKVMKELGYDVPRIYL